jgi:hypothetical protein
MKNICRQNFLKSVSGWITKTFLRASFVVMRAIGDKQREPRRAADDFAAPLRECPKMITPFVYVPSISATACPAYK